MSREHCRDCLGSGGDCLNGRYPAAGTGSTRGKVMRVWLLLVLFVCLAGALYLGFGSPSYEEKSAELITQLEDM